MNRYLRAASYPQSHYQIWERRTFGPFWRWRWVASTPHHSDLTSIVQHGERWFTSAQHKIVWVAIGPVKR